MEKNIFKPYKVSHTFYDDWKSENKNKLFYEKDIANLFISFEFIKSENNIYYVEWYIKYEGIKPELKDIIDMDNSSIEYYDESPSLPFDINKYFCKKNGLHIKIIDNYMVVPLIVIFTRSTNQNLLILDISIKNNFTTYKSDVLDLQKKSLNLSMYSNTHFWENTFIKIPCKEKQNILPYRFDDYIKNLICKYIIIKYIKNDNDKLYDYIDEWTKKYINLVIKVKPKLSYTLVLFKPYDSKTFHELVRDIFLKRIYRTFYFYILEPIYFP